jgi:hypothetical protein
VLDGSPWNAPITVKDGEVTHAAMNGQSVENTITAATLTFDGTRAKVTWTSSGKGESDFDVRISDSADHTLVVVDATGSEYDQGALVYQGTTTHTRIFEMGTAATAKSYVAEVSIKGRVGSKFVSGATLFDNLLSAATLSFDGAKAKVTWTSAGDGPADYDVVIVDGSDNPVVTDTAVDSLVGYPIDGTSHWRIYDFGEQPYVAYRAKIKLKDRPATEITSSATTYLNNVINPLFEYDGNLAKITWTSSSGGATDFDVELQNAGGVMQVKDDTVEQRTGTSHSATLNLGSLAAGSYKVRVNIKNQANSSKTTATKAYTPPAVSDQTLTNMPFLNVKGASRKVVVKFNSSSAASTNYIFKIYQADFSAGADFTVDPSNLVDMDPNTDGQQNLTATGSSTTNVFEWGLDTDVMPPGKNYRVEVYVGTELLGLSPAAPHVADADPIIGTCVVYPVPECTFE